MKFIKSIASALLCAIVTSGYSFPSGIYTNTFVRNGTTYVQRGQLKPSDYVVTNVNITAEQIDALPLVEDSTGAKTAVTIGTRVSGGTVGMYSIANGQFTTASGSHSHAEGDGTTASGDYSHAEGQGTTASGICSHAEGGGTTASGYYSHAEGGSTTASGICSHAEGYVARAKDDYAYSWNGNSETDIPYFSHGKGTFNINPVGGTDGFYVGEQTLSDIISGIVTNNISADNPTFANAVLAVGLNIDTNSVAVLNDIAATFGGFPIEGTATTIGGLLAALAAAVAWLRKNKADKATTLAGYGITDAATKEELAALTAKVEYPLYAVPSTGVLKDRAINTTSLATVTVPDNFTDLLIRASVTSSLSVTMPDAITTKYGDTFPGEAGEYLITITKTGTDEAYVRTIKLEDVA